MAKFQKPSAPKEIQFTGAVLRHLRQKAKLSLGDVAAKIGFSICYLSYLETGVKPVPNALRDRLMRLYGYSPSSFKNFTTEDKRSKSIPVRHKLDVLLRHLREEEVEKVLAFALEQRQGFGVLQTKERDS